MYTRLPTITKQYMYKYLYFIQICNYTCLNYKLVTWTFSFCSRRVGSLHLQHSFTSNPWKNHWAAVCMHVQLDMQSMKNSGSLTACMCSLTCNPWKTVGRWLHACAAWHAIHEKQWVAVRMHLLLLSIAHASLWQSMRCCVPGHIGMHTGSNKYRS